MNWSDDLLTRLAAGLPAGYHPDGPASSEPTALAALALVGHRRESDAARALGWLAEHQADDGSIGITATQNSPCWPTGWAMLAHLAAERSTPRVTESGKRFDLDRAVGWTLRIAGATLPRTPDLGHDSTLVGWPWIETTHSWVEPTAIAVASLKGAGHGDHPRTREAVRLLIDRLLPEGGCNYGNTYVMGQELRPHVQPTGLALLALTGEADADGRIARSLDYLARELSSATTATSLSYGLIGLAAWKRFPSAAPAWLEAAYRRVVRRDAAAYPLALIGLALTGTDNPLVALVQRKALKGVA